MDTNVRSQSRCRYNWTTRNLHLSPSSSSLLFAASRSRHPDSPFDLSLSNHHPFSSLVLAPRSRHRGFSPSGVSPVRLFFSTEACQCFLLFLLHSHLRPVFQTLFALRCTCVRACVRIYVSDTEPLPTLSPALTSPLASWNDTRKRVRLTDFMPLHFSFAFCYLQLFDC